MVDVRGLKARVERERASEPVPDLLCMLRGYVAEARILSGHARLSGARRVSEHTFQYPIVEPVTKMEML